MIQRILAIMQKEWIQTLRDRGTLAILLTLPLAQLILFAYAINMNVRHIPTAVANQSKDQASRDFVDSMVNSGYFDVVQAEPDERGVVQAIDSGAVHAGIVIPPGFAKRSREGHAQVLVLVDGSDLFTAQSAYNAANLIGQVYAANVTVRELARTNPLASQATLMPLTAHIRILYNPDMKDLWFIIPGMAALLLQTQSIVLTASAVVREREMGTIEQILVTPIRPFELMIGKVSVNLLIAIFNMLSVIGMGVFWFQVPFQGSFWLFMALVFLYVFSGLGLGLLVSTISQNQRQAQQLILLFYMVAIVLGGFIFPRYTMPPFVQLVGNIFPMSYFVPISRGIITKGVGFSAMIGEVIALVVYVLVVMFLATRAFRERLD